MHYIKRAVNTTSCHDLKKASIFEKIILTDDQRNRNHQRIYRPDILIDFGQFFIPNHDIVTFKCEANIVFVDSRNIIDTNT